MRDQRPRMDPAGVLVSLAARKERLEEAAQLIESRRRSSHRLGLHGCGICEKGGDGPAARCQHRFSPFRPHCLDSFLRYLGPEAEICSAGTQVHLLQTVDVALTM